MTRLLAVIGAVSLGLFAVGAWLSRELLRLAAPAREWNG